MHKINSKYEISMDNMISRNNLNIWCKNQMRSIWGAY